MDKSSKSGIKICVSHQRTAHGAIVALCWCVPRVLGGLVSSCHSAVFLYSSQTSMVTDTTKVFIFKIDAEGTTKALTVAPLELLKNTEFMCNHFFSFSARSWTDLQNCQCTLPYRKKNNILKLFLMSPCLNCNLWKYFKNDVVKNYSA